ncbi:MAG: hypothetical protein M1839_008277 [Geoglossum umbratile]|nr:MAG: hypothetical protein M1839_008277 [Geoglossum umbratile]
MPAEDVLSDSHVAELLKKDAADRSLRYSAMGLQAFFPKRPTTNAPKPNTRFLRNIIRETDSHNAALRAKEADESRARLKALQGELDPRRSRSSGGPRRHAGDTRSVGQTASDKESGNRKRRKLGCDSDEDEKDRGSHRRRSSHKSSREDYGERERRKGTRDRGDDSLLRDRHSRGDKNQKRRRSRSVERSRTKRDGDTGHRRRRRSHSRTRSSAKEREGDERYHRTRRRRHSSVSSSSMPRTPSPHQKEPRSSMHRRTASPPPPPSPSDSDPLTSIIGPKPEPTPQPRGRGAFTSSTAMDAHFSPTYNPALDILPSSSSNVNSDADDWDQALEALRDRERWKQAGAKRLRDAGFTEEEVKKWEGEGGRKEEDVKWGNKGEGREWDRGKVIGEDGWVDVRAEWGRLK